MAHEAAPDLRRVEAPDLPFVWQMLGEAAHWRLPAETDRPAEPALRADGSVGRYLNDWGRPGDDGMIAWLGDEPAGACWYRLFTPAEAGYGFVNPRTPELSLGVVRVWRRRGIGAALLAATLSLARAAGHPALSLSVEADNPARRLYERAGFVRGGAVANAWTMIVDLRRAERSRG
jgi:GNAT superfamily N-acetyltransferase